VRRERHYTLHRVSAEKLTVFLDGPGMKAWFMGDNLGRH
jgi:hypothetical protein